MSAKPAGGSAITHLVQLDPQWDAHTFPSSLTTSTLDTSDPDICPVFHMVQSACDFDFFMFTLRSLHGRSLYEYLCSSYTARFSRL